MTGPHLVIDNTKTLPAIDTFAFAIGGGSVIASRNGVEVKVSEALIDLARVIGQMAIDQELRTAKALSEPRSIL